MLTSKNFVLVAGSWVGGWAWNAVVNGLENEGHRVVTPTLPGVNPGDDPSRITLMDGVRFLQQFLITEDLRDVVLVSHDISGYPVTAVANRERARVGQIIHWSAFVPTRGECIFDSIPEEDTVMLKAGAARLGGHAVLAPFARWQSSFVHTAPEPVQTITYSLLRPSPIAYFADKLSDAEAALPEVPIRYLVGDQDMSLTHDEHWWAPLYSERAGVEADKFDGTHAAHLIAPDALTTALLRCLDSGTEPVS